VSELLTATGVILAFGSVAFCLMMALATPKSGFTGRIFRSDDAPFVVIGIGLLGVLMIWLGTP